MLNMDPEETKGMQENVVFELVRTEKIQRIKKVFL